MGAHAALQLALNWPAVFGVVGMHSPVLRQRADLPDFFGDEAWFDAHDPVHLAGREVDVARSLRLWVDVGASDPWLPSIVAFEQGLAGLGVSNEFHVFPGGHEGPYWTANLWGYLSFYGTALKH